MNYKEIVKAYVESNDPVEMEMLTELTNDFVYKVKEHHPELVKDYLWGLKVYLHPLEDRERAEYIVSMFKNKDGSEGAHWDYDTTTKVMETKGYSLSPCVWYYALNMIYSDYYNKEFSDSVYIQLAYDFLMDKDAPSPKEKATKYIRAMMF